MTTELEILAEKYRDLITDEDRIFIESSETLETLGLPSNYFNTIVEKDNPTYIIGFMQGQIFDCTQRLLVSNQIKEYIVTLRNDHEFYLYADSNETAKFMVDEMFNPDLLRSLEKETKFRSIVWTSAE